MGKYDPLGALLAKSSAKRVALTFKEIERILGGPLPASAYAHHAWWSNTGGSHVQARAWLTRGFRTEQVDLAGEKLVFERESGPRSNGPDMRDLAASMVGNAKQHPAIGAMKGMITFVPGVDLTQPVDPEWVTSLSDTDAFVGGLDDPKPGN